MARTQIDEDIPILRSERNDFSLFNNTPSIQNLCNRRIQRIDMTFTYRNLHYILMKLQKECILLEMSVC